MNPLAARIARAKTEILDCDPDLVVESISTLQESISRAPQKFPKDDSEFRPECMDEIARWFPDAVVWKLNWLLWALRKGSAGAIQNFFEVVLSSVIREVSQQEPSDLRIRYRKELISDADLIGLFSEALQVQFARIEKFWKVRGLAPRRFLTARVVQGDNRDMPVLEKLGVIPGTIDAILTSPPYATALPYIDTDRLSLLVIDKTISSSERRPIENDLTGSREIGPVERRKFEAKDADGDLPPGARKFVGDLKRRLAKDETAGFRKQNMPALLTRYLIDMQQATKTMLLACKPGGDVMIVIGDNKTEVGGKTLRIPATDLLEEIACSVGFEMIERIDISVTTENYLHQKNAITENVVLRMRKPRD